jgi:hypothetical protein
LAGSRIRPRAREVRPRARPRIARLRARVGAGLFAPGSGPEHPRYLLDLEGQERIHQPTSLSRDHQASVGPDRVQGGAARSYLANQKISALSSATPVGRGDYLVTLITSRAVRARTSG